jgi:cation/acetate symporter
LNYSASPISIGVFAFFVAVVLGISFYLGRKAKSAKGYYAAHGEIPWFVNGVAFAGDYLSAASFLGICGLIALYGYDGFLYSIGYLAGWVVALFVVAEPLKRLGKFTFADALDSKFDSRGIKLAAAISTLVVSIFYLIPQMVGAGALIKPLLGFPHAVGVVTVGVVVILIVTTAGMVSTTWVQFIKGSLLVLFCAGLVVAILMRGHNTTPIRYEGKGQNEAAIKAREVFDDKVAITALANPLPPTGAWAEKPYIRVLDKDGNLRIYKIQEDKKSAVGVQYKQVDGKTGKTTINGDDTGKRVLQPVSYISELPAAAGTEMYADGSYMTGPQGPLSYLATIDQSTIAQSKSETIKDADGTVTTVFYNVYTPGSELLTPGASPAFKGVRSESWHQKLNFLSLMLALFCGTASLPHILIRYYTVKDQASSRKSTMVGIASIGFFYILTLYLGLAAMTSGVLDPADAKGNMAAPLLARSFGELPFAIISAIAFTTVLGTVSGLIMAASGTVAHDLMTNLMKIKMDDHGKVKAGKCAAIGVGIVAIILGIVFEKMNVSFLVGWAFSVAASANLPALVMLLFWKKTTKEGIAAAIFAGMIASLGWILLSGDTYKDVYGWKAEDAIVPFSQPGIVTIPLGFIVLVVVSLLTQHRRKPVVQ